ncbi:MAG TPA: hypothetical protein VIS05_07565 [Ilumatobacter sp.]
MISETSSCFDPLIVQTSADSTPMPKIMPSIEIERPVRPTAAESSVLVPTSRNPSSDSPDPETAEYPAASVPAAASDDIAGLTAAAAGVAARVAADEGATAGEGSPVISNWNDPLIGWASPACTLHRSPYVPASSDGSKVSTNDLPSVESMDDGDRTVPSGSSSSNPFPAGRAGFVKLTTTSLKAPSTTAPAAGTDESKSVWADAIRPGPITSSTAVASATTA